MTERDFCFWLQGYMELSYTDSPTVDQWKVIKSNLAIVFNKKAPYVDEVGTQFLVKTEYDSPEKALEAIRKYKEEWERMDRLINKKY